MEQRKLYRVRDKRMLAGVCAGMAEYFDTDVTLMRILWLVGIVFTNIFGLLIYFAAAVIMPEKPAR